MRPWTRAVRLDVERDLAERGPEALHAELAPAAAASVHPNDRKRVSRLTELARAGVEPHLSTEGLWTERLRRPARLFGLTCDRDLLDARIEARVDAMAAAGAAAEVARADAAGASRTARAAIGFDQFLAGDVEAVKAAQRRLARRQLTWMRRMPGVEAIDRGGPRRRRGSGRDRRRPLGFGVMRFEKWQALGNDYVIVERDELPWELTAERIRRICQPHLGVGSDGILLLAPAGDPAHVAELRIFNPDGSEAELSGNGAREAVLYLRSHGWTDRDTFSVTTKAGVVTPTITGSGTAAIDIGRASLTSADYPAGPGDGTGTVESGGRQWSFQHVNVGNPQCAIEVADGLEELDLGAFGPAIEANTRLFPNRTNVSFWRADGSTVRARIFERGVGETLSSGTGASGAAVAAHLRGAASPITVALDGGELEVAVGPELDVTLTGSASPVYAGELSPEFVRALGDS